MKKKRIYLNAFDMNCVAHQSPGLWVHPEDQSYRYKDIEYWVELAQLLEKGRFDGLFIADVIGIYDVYGNDKTTAVREATQVPVNDPILLVSAMAHATEHLGFGITCSTTFEHPYTFARRMSTLDHLTKGRVGWNIVTSYLESGTKNIDIGDRFLHSERYNIAEEYLEVCYKLWEGSWEDDAVIKDRDRKIFTDPAKVHEINHHGKYFNVPGIHLCEPSPQRTPVLYQAGASARGRQFAAKHAECTFVSMPGKEPIASYVKNLRAQAAEFGRDPQSIKVFALFTPIVGRTEEEAWAKYEELSQYISYEGALSLLGGWSGVDFSKYDPDQEIEYIDTNAIKSVLESLTKASPNKKWTVRELANFAGIGGMGPVVVGTPKQIADTFEEWIEDTDIDGFNLAYAITPGTFKDFVDLVIPELQQRGVVKKEYEEGTLREKLFGKGQSRLPEDHIGAKYRNLSYQLQD
ncbi:MULTISPECIES: LLM class flavin-dependent oxidoreductase [Aeribacillus]|jgi:FMN-dependent oxidoreductase, nitrilotriacetate monooxygenase family|uniref:LLM class flavin-dependent oxidoreductase n=1 Tax=Aeribacillus composti TaxID=1868734 RepID=A0ABY9WBA5_9BACI|nr:MULTISPECIES: LLM class flavin-dependent oxidoreductase [Aeribacillus]REJ26015.1 MAG: FMN-dependent monooxygenase [Bacillaceae bacterium]KZM57469.1 5,10-methylene tetrahydromethanopterin reductase [Aeribacillus pallidus]MDR9797429.1 LLM class flavin-dependent oxidoreductase [Aeribacillus pallidus]MED0650229.1 LLM class flavin-dependent oxidoreductase [Aeribacillus composti]MED0702400.1 LLM class flavin-dependent oxidoreductase [Aeribacillus composti]